jgi:hypothetical protein
MPHCGADEQVVPHVLADLVLELPPTAAPGAVRQVDVLAAYVSDR